METSGSPKKRKRKDKKQTGATPTQLLMKEVGLACKANDIERGLAAYRAAREVGTQLLPSVFNMLIALCSGLSNHMGGVKEGSACESDSGPAAGAAASGGGADDAPSVNTAHFEAAFELYADAKAASPVAVKLQEQAYTSLMRVCEARGDPAKVCLRERERTESSPWRPG